MTRDEAIELARTRTGQADPANFIDLCAALGMLKLDDPPKMRTATHHFIKAADAIRPLIDCSPALVIEAIETVGLKIVEK